MTSGDPAGDTAAQGPVVPKVKSGMKFIVILKALRQSTRMLANDLGLFSDTREILGQEWQEFCEAWVAAEMALEKAGGPKPSDLAQRTISVPGPLQDWHTKQRIPSSPDPNFADIGAEMQAWWRGLQQLDTSKRQDWMVSGPTGVLLLVLGMRMWGQSLSGEERNEVWLPILLEMQKTFQDISHLQDL